MSIDQKQLDNYRSKKDLSRWELGIRYERYIGYLYENADFYVVFHGAINGYKDMGIDLIVQRENQITIIQAKHWARNIINEKDVLKLYGSLSYYIRSNNFESNKINAALISSSTFSERSKHVANVLGIDLISEKYDPDYPMIKCNVSQNGERIYHLPCDPYYDKVAITWHKDDCYVQTVKEAVELGFRRARNYSKAA